MARNVLAQGVPEALARNTSIRMMAPLAVGVIHVAMAQAVHTAHQRNINTDTVEVAYGAARNYMVQAVQIAPQNNMSIKTGAGDS